MKEAVTARYEIKLLTEDGKFLINHSLLQFCSRITAMYLPAAFWQGALGVLCWCKDYHTALPMLCSVWDTEEGAGHGNSVRKGSCANPGYCDGVSVSVFLCGY